MDVDRSPSQTITIPASDSNREALIYQSNNVVKRDPENKTATEVLDKDIKRWKRKLEELKRLRVPWSTICFGIGTSGVSFVLPFINANTKLISIQSGLTIIFMVLILVAIMLWKIYECNIPKIAEDILMDLPRLDTSGEQNESE